MKRDLLKWQRIYHLRPPHTQAQGTSRCRVDSKDREIDSMRVCYCSDLNINLCVYSLYILIYCVFVSL